jgi:nitrile hydratase
MTNAVAEKNWRRVIAKAWADEDFKRRLMEEPEAVLKEEGISISPGKKIRVMEDTPRVCTLVIPTPPDEYASAEEVEQRLAAMMFPPFGF